MKAFIPESPSLKITILNLPINCRSLSFLGRTVLHYNKIPKTLCFLSYFNIDNNEIQTFSFFTNTDKPFLQAFLLTDCKYNLSNNVIGPK